MKIVIYTFNHSRLRAQVGDYHIDKAYSSIEKGDIREGWYYAQVGVARSPGNIRGRLLLADLYVLSRQPDKAAEIYLKGIPYAENDLNYVRDVVTFLLKHSYDLKLTNLAERMLPANPADAEDIDKMVALAGARANLMLGDINETSKLINLFGLDEAVEGRILRAEIIEKSGHIDAARKYLEKELYRISGQDTAPLYVKLIEICKQLGDRSGALRYASLYTVAYPMKFKPRLYLIDQLSEANEHEKRTTIIEQTINSFKHEPESLLSLASYAAEEGDLPLCRKVYDTAIESNLLMAYFSLLLIEAHAVAGEFEKALSYCEELSSEAPTWLDKHEFVFDSLLALCHRGLGNTDLAWLNINKSLAHENVSYDSLLATGRRFKNLEWLEEAREFFAEAFQRDPGKSNALVNLIDIDLTLGNSFELTQNLTRVLEIRQPGNDLLFRALEDLSSDRFIFAQNRLSLLQNIQAKIEDHSTLPAAEKDLVSTL